MRDDITYGIRDAEILKNASGFFFLELVIYAYVLGKTDPVVGGIFFTVVLLSMWTSKTLSQIILVGFTFKTAHYAYEILAKSQDTTTTYVFVAIAFIFLSLIHINTYFYFHES